MVGVADDGHGSIWKARCSGLGSSDQIMNPEKVYGFRQAQLFSFRTQQSFLYCSLRKLTLKLANAKFLPQPRSLVDKLSIKMAVAFSLFGLRTPHNKEFFLSDRRAMALASNQQSKNPKKERNEECQETCYHI